MSIGLRRMRVRRLTGPVVGELKAAAACGKGLRVRIGGRVGILVPPLTVVVLTRECPAIIRSQWGGGREDLDLYRREACKQYCS